MHKTNLNHITLFLAFVINLLVATNSVLHDPFMAYDSDAHMDYVSVLATRLPIKADSLEYYSPPLPYFLPALVFKVCTSDINTCKLIAGKFGQGINLLLSVGITIFLFKIAELIKPGNLYFKFASLFLLGILTVYYKTFSQVRGEPYLAFFEILSIYYVLKIARMLEFPPIRDIIIFGICLGGLGLSRQWGFFLFPAIGLVAVLLFIHNKTAGFNYGKALTISVFIAFLVCSWFYFHLLLTYGSFTTFSLKQRSFSFSNQPSSFYRSTGIKNFMLFRSPTRRVFDNQLIPSFYSDTWGDYWGYFTFVRNVPTLNYESNQAEITPYLGRVNIAALLPSAILIFGAILGLVSLINSLRSSTYDLESLAGAFFFLILLVSLTGFLWFLIKYPDIPKGGTVKAPYMIQIFMVLPFLGAMVLEKIRLSKPGIYQVIAIVLAFIFLHNIPAMITRYF